MVIPGLAKREPGSHGSVECNASCPWVPGSAFGRPGMTPLRRCTPMADTVLTGAVGAQREPKAKPGPLEYMRQWPLRVIVGATLVFLYAPLITLMAFSFNTSRRNIVWEGFTFDWYGRAMGDASLVQAFINSLTIAFIYTLLSVVLGAMLAVLLWRF